MAHQIEAGSDALVMDARDHVATALRDIAAGDRIWQQIREAAEGKLTKAEFFGHQEFSINRIGPSL